ncbi:hypothetical protein [Lichenibacterium minor]|nr:hypothetical protein [Lichenibacterium minor]
MPYGRRAFAGQRSNEGDDIMARTLWTAALVLGFVLAMSMTRRRPQ